MTQLLSIGYPQAMVQNQVYALPSRKVTVFATLACEVANDDAFAVKATVAAATPTDVAATFIRCTTGTTGLISLKTA
jgi:hypothetical protein